MKALPNFRQHRQQSLGNSCEVFFSWHGNETWWLEARSGLGRWKDLWKGPWCGMIWLLIFNTGLSMEQTNRGCNGITTTNKTWNFGWLPISARLVHSLTGKLGLSWVGSQSVRVLGDLNLSLVGGLEHFLFSHILGCDHHPNWLSHFSEGWPNYQPVICLLSASFMSQIVFVRPGLLMPQVFGLHMNYIVASTYGIEHMPHVS